MNIIRGYITSILGLGLILLAIADYYGFIDSGFPHKTIELFVLGILGFILLWAKATDIEAFVTSVFKTLREVVVEFLRSLFTKKPKA